MPQHPIVSTGFTNTGEKDRAWRPVPKIIGFKATSRQDLWLCFFIGVNKNRLNSKYTLKGNELGNKQAGQELLVTMHKGIPRPPHLHHRKWGKTCVTTKRAQPLQSRSDVAIMTLGFEAPHKEKTGRGAAKTGSATPTSD